MSVLCNYIHLTALTLCRFLNVTVGVAARNALVSVEVVCWFFLGEIIGRRSLVGYKVSNK